MDYRYFPEPDLPPLSIESTEIEAVLASLPELPERQIQRWVEVHGLGLDEARTLAQSPAFAAYFETLARLSGTARGAAAWLLGEVSRTLNERGIGIEAFPLSPESLAGLVALVEARTISFGAAKDQVFPALLAGEGSADAIVAAKGLAQVRDRGAIEALVAQVLAAHPGPVAQIKGGKDSLRGFLVGQVLKAGGGKVDPALVQEVLSDRLANA